jgi:proline iminopeptidase
MDSKKNPAERPNSENNLINYPISVEDGCVDRGGFRLYFRALGNGPPLLILSGGPGMAVDYMQPVADELCKTHRCILLEQRGTGRSKLEHYDGHNINLKAFIEDIDALQRHIGAQKLTLLGNSWGMILALVYGIEYPSKIQAIITAGSGSIALKFFDVFHNHTASRLNSAEMEALKFWSTPQRIAANPHRAHYKMQRIMLSSYFFERKNGTSFGKKFRPDDTNPYIPLLMMDDLRKRGWNLRPKLQAITAPVLLVQGRQDPAGEANILETHRAIKGSNLRFLDSCGHFPWLEQPAQFFEIVRKFLYQLK